MDQPCQLVLELKRNANIKGYCLEVGENFGVLYFAR